MREQEERKRKQEEEEEFKRALEMRKVDKMCLEVMKRCSHREEGEEEVKEEELIGLIKKRDSVKKEE